MRPDAWDKIDEHLQFGDFLSAGRQHGQQALDGGVVQLEQRRCWNDRPPHILCAYVENT